MSINTALLAYEQAREQSRKSYTLWASNDSDREDIERRRQRMEISSRNFRESFEVSDWPVYAVESHITNLCLDAMPTVDTDLVGGEKFMPTPQGFMYFMEPFAIEMPDHVEALRYIVWQQGVTDQLAESAFSPYAPLWEAEPSDVVRATVFSMGAWCPVDKLTMVRNHFPWRHGEPLSSIRPTDHVAPYALGFIRIVAAMGLFMQQKVAVSHAARASRNVYRQTLRRTGKEPPELRVVKLRASESRVYEHVETHGREWSMRWVVRGHWRNQWFPKKQVYSQIWIAPYIKGPEGKPVVGGRKVFDVSR